MSVKKNIFIYNADEVNADTIKNFVKEKKEVIREKNRIKELEALYPNGQHLELPFVWEKEAQELERLYKFEEYRQERIKIINSFIDNVINKDNEYFTKLCEYREKDIISSEDLIYCMA